MQIFEQFPIRNPIGFHTDTREGIEFLKTMFDRKRDPGWLFSFYLIKLWVCWYFTCAKFINGFAIMERLQHQLHLKKCTNTHKCVCECHLSWTKKTHRKWAAKSNNDVKMSCRTHKTKKNKMIKVTREMVFQAENLPCPSFNVKLHIHHLAYGSDQ